MGSVESVGMLVRRAREDRRMTQDELAQRADKTREWVSALERDVMRRPGWEALERVEFALDLPRGQLRSAAGYNVAPAPEPRAPPPGLAELLRRALELVERGERCP